jgi:hypothetical protein
MRAIKIKSSSMISFSGWLPVCFLLGITILFFSSCASTVTVYHPPRFDLTGLGRLGIITFSDNAEPSVAEYATRKFQSEIQTAQVGVPIVELGTENEVLERIGSGRLDPEAFEKIAQQYKVAAVFTGSVIYSDIKTDVNIKDITRLSGSVDTKLNGILSVKLIETGSVATLWSDSTSWNRKLGKISVNNKTGVSVGLDGYDDAYRKLIPDMAYAVTNIFRGRYVKERVKN